MPMAIPIIAAAATAAGGVAAVSAGMSLVGGLMLAGSAFSAIGAITGNKDMSRFGMVLGIAGGVGSLASAAGEAAAGEIASEAATNASTEALGQSAAGAATDAAGTAALSESAAPAAVEAAGGGAAEALSPAATAGGAEAAGAAAAPAAGDAASVAGTVGDAATPAASALSGPQVAPVAGSYSPGAGFTADSGIISGAQNPSMFDQISGAISKGAQWVEKNPGIAKIGGGIIQGAAQAYGAQQQRDAVQDQLAAQQAYMDKIRQRYSDSVRNLTVPTFNRPASPNQPQAGLINTNRTNG